MRHELPLRDVEFPASPPPPPEAGAPVPVEHAWPRAIIPRSRREVLAGFSQQRLRIDQGGRILEVVQHSGPAGVFPFDTPVLIVGSVDAGDRPTAPSMLPQLAAVAVAADLDWIDPARIVPDVPAARRWAATTGARFLVAWDSGGQSVIDMVRDEVVLRSAAICFQRTRRTCPVIVDSPAGRRCRPIGGPWTGRSMRAARYWQQRRDEFYEFLGCDEACVPPLPREVYGATRYRQVVGRNALAPPERHVRVGDRCLLCRVSSDQGCDATDRPWAPSDGAVLTDTRSHRRHLPAGGALTLRKGESLRIGGNWRDVLSRMTVDPTGGPEDPLDWDEADPSWLRTDADIAAAFPDLEVLARWAVIGDLRISSARLRGRFVPVAFDLRTPELLTPA